MIGKLARAAGIVAALGAATAGAQDSGVAGKVVLSPTCPGPAGAPEIEALKCLPRPIETIVAIYAGTGGAEEPAFRVATDESGNFRFALAPGRYTLVPRAPDPLAFGQPEDVVVTAGAFTEVTLIVDSGLR